MISNCSAKVISWVYDVSIDGGGGSLFTFTNGFETLIDITVNGFTAGKLIGLVIYFESPL